MQNNFIEKEFKEVEGGWYDHYGFYYTPNGSFWDDEGYYFNRDGFDKHGGYYDNNCKYVPGEGWDPLNECYKSEVDLDYVDEEEDEFDEFDKAEYEKYKNDYNDIEECDDYGIDDEVDELHHHFNNAKITTNTNDENKEKENQQQVKKNQQQVKENQQQVKENQQQVKENQQENKVNKVKEDEQNKKEIVSKEVKEPDNTNHNVTKKPKSKLASLFDDEPNTNNVFYYFNILETSNN
jgi:hypothetical protein